MKISNVGDLLKNVGKLRKEMEKVQADLKNRVIETSSGGGLVKVLVNGQQEVLKITIDPKAAAPEAGGIEMLEDLVVAAIPEILARDVLEVRVPTPTVPEGMRTKIAELIRDLADPEYATRQTARKALAELGHLPKLQLEEALGQTTDPEVRRSVQALLEALKD